MARSKLLIIGVLLLWGCRSARTVVVEIPAGRSAVSIESDTSYIPTPPLRPLPLYDLGLSVPIEVERFHRLREGRSFNVQRLTVDRTGEDDEIIIETPGARYRFRAPARGERLEISNRSDSTEADSLLGSVTGEPVPERHEILIEDPDSLLDRWLRLVKWAVALVAFVLLAFLALRLVR